MTVGGDAERGGEKRGAPLSYSVPPTVTHKHKGTHFFWVPTDIWGFLSGAQCLLLAPWTQCSLPEPHKTTGNL